MKVETKNYIALMQKIFVLILFILASSASQLYSQSKSKTSEPIQRMEKFLGHWEGNVHSETGPVVTSKEIKTSFDFSRTCKDLAVLLSAKFESDSTHQKMESYSVMAYEMSKKEIHMMMLNDSGEVYDLTGKWTNDYSLNFTCNTVRNGKNIGITLWMIVKIKDQLEYKRYTNIGEDLLISDSGILSRKKSGKSKD